MEGLPAGQEREREERLRGAVEEHDIRERDRHRRSKELSRTDRVSGRARTIGGASRACGATPS
jgi:hypothetical protein